MDIFEFAKGINTQKDFKDNIGEWDNHTLEQYLDALYGYSLASHTEQNCWRMFADFLLAAIVYE